MSKRAEEAALKAYLPIQMNCDGEIVHPGYDKHTRDLYQEGYEQAEKDLALTWEDIRTISLIEYDTLNGDNPELSPSPRAFYEEVLRKFNEAKEGDTELGYKI